MVETLAGKAPDGVKEVTTSHPALIAAGKFIPVLSLATEEGREDLDRSAIQFVPAYGAIRQATDADLRDELAQEGAQRRQGFVEMLSPAYKAKIEAQKENEAAQRIASKVEQILAEREAEAANNIVSSSRG